MDSTTISNNNNNIKNIENQDKAESEGSSYEMEGSRVLIIIDSDDSTNRALNKAMETFDKQHDELYLLTATSSFDYLNDEKNNAKLSLFKYENYFDSLNIQYIPIQVEAFDIENKIIQEIQENEIDLVYIGASALNSNANPDNLVFSFFSSVKKFLVGTIVSGLEKASQYDGNWKLIVVP
ncbi:hypothetical protein DLAC_09101 [Tieghemostelium lacteum]|uniref:UspA domain-containing protein n=1 Tax=Tieghemostelium lacteum TaxID=361077 RepID=A0A151Z967_TIELA|nr:hypothetical protein DLAC_09101 [Tieghemostelium lacteum]|eukprot:KYQ90476.1 hypothetical protein DLAC_09101 [Tieghemostelium lacteum]